MKTIQIHNKEFVINPRKIPIFTGFRASLGDIFLKPNKVDVVKQLLYCNGYYTTYSKVNDGDNSYWTFWTKPIVLFDEKKISGDDQHYYYKGKEVAIRAWLQFSKHYKGEPGGIFANENNFELMHVESDVYKFMQWLDENDAYYLAYGSFVDHSPNYILK